MKRSAIYAQKAEALAAIRANRPKRVAGGLYVCPFCGGNSSDCGFQQWHTCTERERAGIAMRVYRRKN